MTDNRPRPKYGEYAPITSEPHGEQPPPASAPATAPASAKPQPGTLPSGELQPGEPPQTEAQPAPVATKRRTWDVAVTTALILVGVLDVVGSFAKFGSLAATLRDAYQ